MKKKNIFLIGLVSAMCMASTLVCADTFGSDTTICGGKEYGSYESAENYTYVKTGKYIDVYNFEGTSTWLKSSGRVQVTAETYVKPYAGDDTLYLAEVATVNGSETCIIDETHNDISLHQYTIKGVRFIHTANYNVVGKKMLVKAD